MENQIIERNKVKIYRENIYTRNMYCEKCAENQMPRIGNIAVVYGQTSGRYRPLTIIENSPTVYYGFTPHIISSIKLDWIYGEECITFYKCCAMNGCGIQLRFFPEFGIYDHYFLNNEPDYLRVNDYLALINNKDPQFYVRGK